MRLHALTCASDRDGRNAARDVVKVMVDAASPDNTRTDRRCVEIGSTAAAAAATIVPTFHTDRKQTCNAIPMLHVNLGFY